MLFLLTCDLNFSLNPRLLLLDFLYFFLRSFFNFEKTSVWHGGLRLVLLGQDWLIVHLVCKHQTRIVRMFCYFFLNGREKRLVNHIFCLVWSDLVQLVTVLLVLCDHLIFLLYVTFQFFKNRDVFMTFYLSNFSLHSLALPFIETVLQLAIGFQSHGLEVFQEFFTFLFGKLRIHVSKLYRTLYNHTKQWSRRSQKIKRWKIVLISSKSKTLINYK